MRRWLDEPELTIALEQIDEHEPRSLTRVGDRVVAQLPFAWVAEVWAKSLQVVDDRFCLAADAVDGRGWELLSVTRELGAPERIAQQHEDGVATMSGFDAEWYLRQLAEDTVLGLVSDDSGELANLKHATAALVAVGAIEPAVASAVVGDYGIARAARQGLVEFVLMRLAHSEQAALLRPLPGQRVVGLADQIELPEGTLRLRYATLDENHTAVSAVYTPHGGRRYPGHGWLGRPPGLPPALSNAVLADDQGNTASLEFSGGGSDYRWELTLTADKPLATDTTWLELAGRRFRLLDRPIGLTVQIESLSEADPAYRHLWRQVALQHRLP